MRAISIVFFILSGCLPPQGGESSKKSWEIPDGNFHCIDLGRINSDFSVVRSSTDKCSIEVKDRTIAFRVIEYFSKYEQLSCSNYVVEKYFSHGDSEREMRKKNVEFAFELSFKNRPSQIFSLQCGNNLVGDQYERESIDGPSFIAASGNEVTVMWDTNLFLSTRITP
ncbi:hypothetical protein GGR44_003378 [Sphingobium fontiphilum]|uniref:Uncharacterized protein n=1 Tax=Sphingobium fontiphilum TaxID=944425 RepID=A0A7W6DLL1_9SPHN|nr:hypothetical protein [Sphingobium fontiphilum]MBB3983681.1 hypothetical protein [Sphingobium fontiphilum]